CVIASALVLAEFIVQYFYFSDMSARIDAFSVMLLYISFSISCIILIVFIPNIKMSNLYLPLLKSLNLVKFNHLYIKSVFSEAKRKVSFFSDMNVLTLGNDSAEYTITMVTDPLCFHCVRSLKKAYQLLDSS